MCLSSRSRQVLSNEYFLRNLASIVSIQPRTSPQKFQISFPPRQFNFISVSHRFWRTRRLGRTRSRRDSRGLMKTFYDFSKQVLVYENSKKCFVSWKIEDSTILRKVPSFEICRKRTVETSWTNHDWVFAACCSAGWPREGGGCATGRTRAVQRAEEVARR